MSKQDKTYSRTPEDLERKYNLGRLVQGGNSKEVEELKNNISKLTESLPKILWQNPNPSATFTEQNIKLSSDDYDYLIFVYRYSKNYNRNYSMMTLKGDSIQLISIWTNSGGFGVLARTGECVSNTEYKFSTCYSSMIATTSPIEAKAVNDSIVPYIVYGCKFVN